MLNEIITDCAIIDNLLKVIGHDQDSRGKMSDAKIIPTAHRLCCY